MKAILVLSILALSLLIVQTKDQSQFQKNRLASKLTQFHNNLTQARPWPIHGDHGPVMTNFTKNLTNHKMVGDDLWSWPKFAGHGPVVVKNNTQLPPVEISKNKTGEAPFWQRSGAGPRVMDAEKSKRKFLSS